VESPRQKQKLQKIIITIIEKGALEGIQVSREKGRGMISLNWNENVLEFEP